MDLHEVLVSLYFGHFRSFSVCSSLVVDWRVSECGASATCLGGLCLWVVAFLLLNVGLPRVWLLKSEMVKL